MMRFLAVALILTASVFAACSTESENQRASNETLKVPYLLTKAPVRPMPDQYIAPVLAMDERITKVLLYVNHRQQRYPSGQVRILMNLYNANTAQDEWVDWKVLFYDADNNRIEETEWESTLFPRQIIKTIETRSLRPDVQNFTIIVKTSPRTDPEKTKPLGFVRELEEREAERREKEMAVKQSITQIGISNRANPSQQVATPTQQVNTAADSIKALGDTTIQLMKTIQMMK